MDKIIFKVDKCSENLHFKSQEPSKSRTTERLLSNSWPKEHERWRRGLGERISRPSLPSPLIGRWRAVLAPMRCIVGIVCGSPPVAGNCCLVLFRCGRRWCRVSVLWTELLGGFKNVAETVTGSFHECGAKSRRIPSREGWRRVQSGGVWRRCVRS